MKTVIPLFVIILALAACQGAEDKPATPAPPASSSPSPSWTPTSAPTETPPPPSPVLPAVTAEEQVTLVSATPAEPTCAELEKSALTDQEKQRIAAMCGLPSDQASPTPTVAPTATVFAPPKLAAPAPVGSPIGALNLPLGPDSLAPFVTDQIVTALYVDDSGAIYYGVAREVDGVHNPSLADHAVWKKLPGAPPIQLTPYLYRLIGGIVVHNGTVYFNEGGQPGDGLTHGVGNLRRMPDDNGQHKADIVLHYPSLSVIWAHVNHALAIFKLNGQDVLLMAVGSIIDSNYDSPDHLSAIQPPFYEAFPTGRILFANFSWLDSTSNYQVTEGVAGQFDEFARGFRNPWAMTTGKIGGQVHVYAVDNDPAFTPAKSDPAFVTNTGDEVNDVFQAKDYGHPFAYGGTEAAIGDIPPIAGFPKGSVPSGVAVASGKLFVSLHDAGIVVKVDVVRHTWTPVLKQVQAFNLFGNGNLLYVADFSGVHVIDASRL